MAAVARKRVGVVGFGAVGKYLTRAILTDPVASKVRGRGGRASAGVGVHTMAC